MARVVFDPDLVSQCRRVSAEIAAEVQGFIDRHTTTGVERTVARALGVEGVDAHGTPLVNTLVERLLAQGVLGLGVSHALGCEMLARGCSIQEAAERLAYVPQAERPHASQVAPSALRGALEASVHAGLRRIDAARAERERSRAPPLGPPGPPASSLKQGFDNRRGREDRLFSLSAHV